MRDYTEGCDLNESFETTMQPNEWLYQGAQGVKNKELNSHGGLSPSTKRDSEYCANNGERK
jgi:hypothetical protein